MINTNLDTRTELSHIVHNGYISVYFYNLLKINKQNDRFIQNSRIF